MIGYVFNNLTALRTNDFLETFFGGSWQKVDRVVYKSEGRQLCFLAPAACPSVPGREILNPQIAPDGSSISARVNGLSIKI